MKVYKEISIIDFEAWSGAVETQEKIIDAGKAEEFDALIEEIYTEGIDETTLNDLLWFDDEWIFETLEIEEEITEDK